MKISKLIVFLFFIVLSVNVFSNQSSGVITNDNQNKIIIEILAKYDSASLGAENAKAIHEEFRLAEIRINPEIESLMEEIGFDSQKLKALSPRQEEHGKDERKPENRSSERDEANIKFVENSINSKGDFYVESSGVDENGFLITNYSGDGKGISMPLKWSNIPKGTKYFALNLWHLPNPEDYAQVKSYWVLYDIPASVNSLPEGVKEIGTTGYNDKNFAGYDPMKSKGAGVKEYNLTVYALSDKAEFTHQKVSRLDLLKALENLIIEEYTLTYRYERKNHK